MTPTLKQQLEQWIEREAIEDSKMLRPQDSPLKMNQREFKAGAQSTLPMLLVAIDGLQGVYYNKFNGASQSVEAKIVAGEALNKIKSMMERNGNE